MYLLGFGLLPALLLWWSRIAHRPFWQDLRFKALATPAVVAIVILTALPFTQNFTSVFRENRALLYVFLVYSDYILFRLIELLQAYDGKDAAAAMIYVSDHGESLGEGNLYLHGLPYALAPEEQKRVPMMVWLSPKFEADSRLDMACLQRHRTDETSHDNLFHSVLGLLDVRTKVYDRALDIFARCRGTAPVATDLRHP